MNAEVLLVNPLSQPRFNGMPMGLLALGSYLEAHGVSTKILDMSLYPSPWERLVSEIEIGEPRLVGITSCSPSHYAALSIARYVRERYPRVQIVKGGVHETLLPTALEDHTSVDFLVRGDGEIPLLGLVQYLRGERTLTSIPGVSWMGEDRHAVHNPREIPKAGPTLDFLPMMNRKLLDNADYYNFPIFDGKRTTQVITSRGCPFKCSFCPASSYSSSLKGPYRWRTVQSVEQELKLVAHDGYQAVYFDDSVFTFNSARVLELCSILSTLGLEWGCQTRVDRVTPALLLAMRKAGCSYVYYGIETGDDHQLGFMQKGIIADKSWTAINASLKAEIRVGASVIVGYPGETDSQIVSTLKTLSRYPKGQVTVSLSMFAVYPGTLDWARALRVSAIKPDAYDNPNAIDDVWMNFDEGYGAIHLVDAEKCRHILELVMEILGTRVFCDLPQAPSKQRL